MDRRSPLVQFAIFILILVLINIVAQVLGLNFRISIIGSIVLTVVVGGIMAALNRPR